MGYASTTQMPSKEFLLERFSYDPETGIVRWKDRPKEHFNGSGYAIFQSKSVGKIVGTTRNGYLVLGLTNDLNKRSTYMLHRLIYKMVAGVDPEFIDHINGIRHDNRWENLRSVSIQENNINARIAANNTTGHTGVYFLKDRGFYISAIFYNGTKIHLGSFDAVASAGAAYKGAAAVISKLSGHDFITDRASK